MHTSLCFKNFTLAIFGFGLAMLTLSIIWFSTRTNNSLITPSSNTPPPTLPISPRSPKIVLGFLPFWKLKNYQPPPTPLTHLVYAHLILDAKGGLVNEPGFNNLKSSQLQSITTKLSDQRQPFFVSFAIFNTSDLEALLINPTTRSQAITTIFDQIQEQNTQGINLDFEPNINPNPNAQALLTSFLQEINQYQITNHFNYPVLLDIYASSKPNGLWNTQELAPYVDYFVIMTYDYHRQNSPQAAPVAPLYGSQNNRFNTDIMSDLKTHLQNIPSQQILLGIPFYGYQWQTTSASNNATTYPKSGSLSTYQDILKLFKSFPVIYNWDYQSFTPWLSFTRDNQQFQIHFDDPTSLSLKLNLVKQLDLAGVAIWALGYEDEAGDLWQTISDGL